MQQSAIKLRKYQQTFYDHRETIFCYFSAYSDVIKHYFICSIIINIRKGKMGFVANHFPFNRCKSFHISNSLFQWNISSDSTGWKFRFLNTTGNFHPPECITVISFLMSNMENGMINDATPFDEAFATQKLPLKLLSGEKNFRLN